jgi:gliding motility-associated-like protein
MKTLSIVLLFVFSLIQSNAQNLSDGLLLHYPFNGNTNDVSVNGFDATGNASLTEDRFGNPNSAYSFDGIDQSISLPYDAALKPQLPISVSAWVKFENFIQSNNNILTTDYTENQYYGIWLNTDGTGRPAINFGDGDPNSTNSTSRRSKIGDYQLEIGIWYMITGVIRGATDMDLYVNCENVGGTYSGTGSSLSYTINPGAIGRGDVAGAAPYFFRGAIDEVYYWDRDLTPLDIEVLIDTGYVQTIYETICQGDTFYYNNVPYFTSGTYTINATNLNFCISNVILELTVVEDCSCRFSNDFSDAESIQIVGNNLSGIISVDNNDLQVFNLSNGSQNTSAWSNLSTDEETFDSFVWSFEFIPEYSISQSRAFVALTDSNLTVANRRVGINYIPNQQDAVAVVIQPDISPNKVNVTLLVKDENKAYIYDPAITTTQPIISNSLIIPNSPLSLNNDETYYLSVTKFNELNYQLSVFSDSAKTQEISNSPICLSLESTENPLINGLNYFQVANNIQSNTQGNFQGVIDKVCLGEFTADFEIVGTDSACAGELVSYSIPSLNSGTVNWDFPADAQLISSTYSSIELSMGDLAGTITANLDLGCFQMELSKDIAVSSQSTAQIIGNTAVCPGDSTLLTVPGNFDSISWNSIENNSNSYYASQGVVFVEAISNSGCSLIDTITIELLPVAEIELSSNPVSCNDDSVLVNASGGFSTYIWNDSITGGSTFYTNPGLITVQNAPGSGCLSFDTLFIESTVLTASFSVEPDTIVQLGSAFSFLDQSYVQGSSINSWNWDFVDNSAQIVSQSPSHTYADTGSYLVSFTVFSDDGCESFISSYVKVVSGITIPNVFSPNGDGINDFFVIELNGIKGKVNLMLFNRWGKLIFEDSDYKNNWAGETSTDGVYFYVADIENLGIFKGYLHSFDD